VFRSYRYHRSVTKPKPSESKLKRNVKSVPWAALLQGSLIVGKRWMALSAKERARLTEILRESRGHLGNLSVKERSELRKLAHRLDLKGMGSELMVLARGRRFRSRRRGRR
jgi:hypothetical protein